MSMDLVRIDNWDLELRGYMDDATQKPFSWAEFNCALNVANAILRITNVDLGAQFRGQAETEDEAYAMIREAGYNDVVEIAASNLPKADSVLQGCSGDVGAFEFDGHQIIGVIYKSRIFSPSPGTVGMGSVSLDKAHTVFKVGMA